MVRKPSEASELMPNECPKCGCPSLVMGRRISTFGTREARRMGCTLCGHVFIAQGPPEQWGVDNTAENGDDDVEEND